MKKKVIKATSFLLSSIIAGLGFGACKTSKNATKEDNNAKPQPVRNHDREIRVVYGPPPAYLQNVDSIKSLEKEEGVSK